MKQRNSYCRSEQKHLSSRCYTSWSLLAVNFPLTAFNELTNPHMQRSQGVVKRLQVLEFLDGKPLKAHTDVSRGALEWEVYKENSSSHVNIHLLPSRLLGGREITESGWYLLMSSVTTVFRFPLHSTLRNRESITTVMQRLMLQIHSHSSHRQRSSVWAHECFWPSLQFKP